MVARHYTLLLLLVYLSLCDVLSSFIIKINVSDVSAQRLWNPWSAENIADYTSAWLDTNDIDNTVPTIYE